MLYGMERMNRPMHALRIEDGNGLQFFALQAEGRK